MANNRLLIVGGAIVAVVIAVIAIAALLLSSNPSSGIIGANVASPTPLEDENDVRTQIYAEMTATAAIIALTNQAGTLVALQETNDAPAPQMPEQGVPANVPTQQIIIVVPTTPPLIITATPQPATPQGNSPSATNGTCSRSGDEINVGANSTGACDTVSATDVSRIISNSTTMADAIAQLNRMCEGKVNACYQYRDSIPSIIPASVFPSQRILWGDTGYINSDTTGLQNRIQRLKCDGNICVYLLLDNQPFSVGQAGRGLLLNQSYPGN